MTVSELEIYLKNPTGHVAFEYKGCNCDIDIISHDKFDMWYGADNVMVDTIDKVLNLRFFNGLPLKKIWNDVKML